MGERSAAQPTRVSAKKTRFFELAEKAGLIGCISGPPDLAQRFKRYLKLKPRAGQKTSA